MTTPRRHSALERFARAIADFTGSTAAFLLALGVVVAWLLTGPFFHYSNTWQLVINTGTTIVTFLMVFLIQRSQNKDSLAMQMKLNELIASGQGASNRLLNVEDLTERDLHLLHRYYRELAAMAKRDVSLTQTHSVEEAEKRHHGLRGGSDPGSSRT